MQPPLPLRDRELVVSVSDTGRWQPGLEGFFSGRGRGHVLMDALAAQGRDIKLSLDRVNGYKAFTNKLWNASRFCQMNGAAPPPDFDSARCRETVNRWLVGEVVA